MPRSRAMSSARSRCTTSEAELKIAIQCFGITRRLSGADTLELELPEAATVRDALTALGARHLDLASVLPQCACARGDAIVYRDTALHHGDELALLPPVAGG